jgi:secreted Zn-dependent insulinase-like peptidase
VYIIFTYFISLMIEHMEDIIGLLFRYIALLQTSGTRQWIFDELVAISEMGFHYRDKSPPIHYVVNISSNMQVYFSHCFGHLYCMSIITN